MDFVSSVMRASLVGLLTAGVSVLAVGCMVSPEGIDAADNAEMSAEVSSELPPEDAEAIDEAQQAATTAETRRNEHTATIAGVAGSVYKKWSLVTHNLTPGYYETQVKGYPCAIGRTCTQSITINFYKYIDRTNFFYHRDVYIEGTPSGTSATYGYMTHHHEMRGGARVNLISDRVTARGNTVLKAFYAAMKRSRPTSAVATESNATLSCVGKWMQAIGGDLLAVSLCAAEVGAVTLGAEATWWALPAAGIACAGEVSMAVGNNITIADECANTGSP
jgi:hypothetical protein